MRPVLFSVIFSIVSCYSEEAPYEVIKTYEDWEVRKYPPTRWISTDAQDVAVHDGQEHSKVARIDSITFSNYVFDLSRRSTVCLTTSMGPMT